MKLSTEELHALQLNTEGIRNVCILAHVDHGKTSLSDNLLASNGIISQRMAGKLRYLDSREDEQLRGITMEASTISLFFRVLRKRIDSEEIEERKHLINLIDSPGHIDFSSEVSTASRLCDGAVVLVDVVEGVCSQTVNVLRQCWVDKLKPLLVINKIDRLITELQLTPAEASIHMTRLIEQVNSVIGSFFAGERMEDDMIWREGGSQGEFVEKDDEHIYFGPERNNVIFASAIDGWAFSINTFAKIYQAKLGFSQNVLTKTLWGDFYLDMKNKKILPGKKVKLLSYKTLFVSLILEPIWAVYQNCVVERDEDKLEKIILKLGVKVGARDLRSKDQRNLLSLVMSQWLPLSHALLGAVIEYLPSPKEAQKERMGLLLDECLYDVAPTEPHDKLLDPKFEKSILDCGSENTDFTLAYISKLLSIPNDQLPKDPSSIDAPEVLTPLQIQEKSRIAREIAKKASEQAALQADAKKQEEYTTAQNDAFDWKIQQDDFEPSNANESSSSNETIMAFTRIYSGALSVGQKIVVVGPKYDPLSTDSSLIELSLHKEVEIKELFLFMGKEFVRMETVPSGNIVGVVGMEDYVLKNATLMSNVDESAPFINLASTKTLIHNKPIMKIAVEPTKLRMLERLEIGLDLLAKADPVLEWYIDDDTGEIIMCVAGELHLERCLKDLEDRFAKGVEVEVMEPVIPFREGLTTGTDSRAVADDDSDDDIDDEDLKIDIEAYPLPQEFVHFLTHHENAIQENIIGKHGDKQAFREVCLRFIEEHDLKFPNFSSPSEFLDNIIAFGPKRIGPNVFAELPSVNKFGHIFKDNENTFEYAHNILNAFQIATNEGPLASEPLQGVLFLLKGCGVADLETSDGEDELEDDIGLAELAKLNEGRIIMTAKELMQKAFLAKAPRLFLAMYTCDIQASAEVLGKVYAVVQQRGGAIISEEMKEGTPFFTISARIPVVEAFGFSEDIRKKTSGAASPQLVFDGFDLLDIDPFWVPHTEEELEELGEFAERENIARRYMNNIRRRKGLFVDEKVVQNAEKQRTLKKD